MRKLDMMKYLWMCAVVLALAACGNEKTEKESGATTEALLSEMVFDGTWIYRLYDMNGVRQSVVCKEYLYQEGVIDVVAWVLYNAEDVTPTYLRGKVLRIEGQEGKNVNGGTVYWDVATNSLTYTPGQEEEVKMLYMTTEGKAVTQKPDVPAMMTVKPASIDDTRNGVTQSYGIVKIASQHWLCQNLRVTAYRDGTPLQQLTQETAGQPGYFHPEGTDIYFYNGEALLAGELAPVDWHTPRVDEWEALVTFLKGCTAAAKDGVWNESTEGAGVAPVSNLSGFYGTPDGWWRNNEHWNAGKETMYWAMNGENIAEEVYGLTGSENSWKRTSPWSELSTEEAPLYKAISLRCIRDY